MDASTTMCCYGLTSERNKQRNEEQNVNQLDHVVIAAPDLDSAKQRFLKTTGLMPVDGGKHVGLGTRNALVSFGEGKYLEIVAPDPEQDLSDGFGAVLASLDNEQLLHWAVSSDSLEALSEGAARLGFNPGAVRSVSRAQPNGTLLEWKLMGLSGHDLGGIVPFYIDWLECPHPADNSPIVGAVELFEITVPATTLLHDWLSPAPDGVRLSIGPPRVRLHFQSPKGMVCYDSTTLQGYPM